ncbi:mucin-associated surface protein (MASP), putative, partial [Trypanosoma cruzi]
MMMMTMTGRVLLVCALCVLWCGACCGEPSEKPPDSSDTPPEKNTQNDNATKAVAAGVVQSSENAAPQAPSPKASESQEMPASPSRAQQSGGATVTPSVKMDKAKQKEEPKDEDEDEEEDEEEEEDEDDAKEEEAQVIISEQATEEEKKEEKKEEAKQKEQQEDGGEVEEKVEGEELEEEDDRRKEEEKEKENEEGDTKKEEAVPDTTEGTSIGTEEQPSLSSAAEGASNITNPNSTQTTGDDAPAADGAGTAEGKQNENKDANPKETPVTAAAMKNITATTGDSDGSTAVSHTTSPLLLLL